MEIEQMLIAALIVNPTAITEAEIGDGDFPDEFCRDVFFNMKKFWHQKQDFVMSDFREILSDDLYAHLQEIASNVLSSSNEQIREYALYLRQDAEKKMILRAIGEINEGMALADMRNVLADIKNSETKTDKCKTGEEILEEIKKSLDMPPACDKTGLQCLDTAMGGGLYQSFVYGICGAEKSGKTTLAHSISYNLDKAGVKHAYFAFEMGSSFIEQRNISRDLGINSLSFLNNREQIKKRLEEIPKRENIFYVDSAGYTVYEIIEQASRIVSKHGIKGFIVDYWQLVASVEHRQTEEKHLRDVAQKLADFAKKNNIWIIILAQMNADGRLFGGGGLKKACEQLYMMRQVEGAEHMRWLEMEASRYTLQVNVGSDAVPSLNMNIRSGPYFEEV